MNTADDDRPADSAPLGSGAPASWDDFFALYATTTVPDDYMTEADRNQGEQTRDPFEGIEDSDLADQVRK